MAIKKKSSPGKSAPPAEASVNPMEVPIIVPTKDVEAIVNAVLDGNRTAAVDVVNRIREIAEPQNPEVFMK